MVFKEENDLIRFMFYINYFDRNIKKDNIRVRLKVERLIGSIDLI